MTTNKPVEPLTPHFHAFSSCSMGNPLSRCLPENTPLPPQEEEKDCNDKPCCSSSIPTTATMSASPSSSTAYAAEREAALSAVITVSHLCRRVQQVMVTADSIDKKDKSPVTVADYAAQGIIIHELTKKFPEYPFIAEEDSQVLQTNEALRQSVHKYANEFSPELSEEALLAAIEAGNTASTDAKVWWTLDPIDGTLGFLRRGQYAVALALMVDNRPVLGVLGCPALPYTTPSGEEKIGCVLVAVQGQGAFIRALDEDAESGSATEVPISVSQNSNPVNAVFTESHAHTSPLNQKITELLQVKAEPVRIDSQCKYAMVARGQSDIYLRLSSLDYQEKIWDHAPGACIVEEAGGVVRDFDGKELDYSLGRTLCGNVGICCTNKNLNGIVYDAIREVDPKAILSK